MLQNFDIDQIVQVMNIVTHGGDGNELELIVAAAKMVIQNYSTGTAKFRLIFNEHRKKLDASGLNQSNGIQENNNQENSNSAGLYCFNNPWNLCILVKRENPLRRRLANDSLYS
jgi:hypothetical protein